MDQTDSAASLTHTHGKAATVVVLREVGNERYNQERLKIEGRFRYTCADPEMEEAEKLAVLAEEFGEVARALLEKRRLANDLHGKDLRRELIQVAAVAVAWAESL